MEEIVKKNIDKGNNLDINPPNDINLHNNGSKRFKYFGQNGEFFIIFLKNMFLTFITLGLYYPWAKVEILKYHYQNTELEGNRFRFTGTGKEIFKGFIKVYIFFVLLYAIVFYAASTQNETLILTTMGLFYIILILLIPVAIHGAIRYRASRSIYSGIHFKYLGNRGEFIKLFFSGLFLTILSFGIYGSWFQVKIRKYILGHLKFGNVDFKFNGKGVDLFLLSLIGMFLSMLTFGIYMFWYQKDLIKFFTNNTKVYQDGEESTFDIEMTGGELFGLLFVNLLIVIFTFGLGAPIVEVRTMDFMLRKMTIKGNLNLETIEQGNTDDYKDASGDDFLDALDLDIM